MAGLQVAVQHFYNVGSWSEVYRQKTRNCRLHPHNDLHTQKQRRHSLLLMPFRMDSVWNQILKRHNLGTILIVDAINYVINGLQQLLCIFSCDSSSIHDNSCNVLVVPFYQMSTASSMHRIQWCLQQV